jgi:cellulose biosynthesis protein BcsQ
MNDEAIPGDIITFYSYKGGTGRSMALANVACLLAKSGGPVLMIDWDLEAPGLHNYFKAHLGEEIEQGLGLIDLFLRLSRTVRIPRNAAREKRELVAADAVAAIDLHEYIVPTRVSGLHLLKAGRFDSQYAAAVNNFNWQRLFDRVPSLFSSFAQMLADTYRYVLIDSRTGVTDISGICTTLMPSKLIVAFSPNQQSLTGLSELVRRAVNYRRESNDVRPLVIFPLPGRVDITESALLDSWRSGDQRQGIIGYQRLFEHLFSEVYGLENCDLENYFNEVQIQYVPRYSYGEEIAALQESTRGRLSLARSYQGFVSKLLTMASPWEETVEPEIAVTEAPEAARPVDSIIRSINGSTATRLATTRDQTQLRRRVREVRVFSTERWPKKIADIARRRSGPSQIPQEGIYDFALPVVRSFHVDVAGVEEFVLTFADAEYIEGLRASMRVLEDWISMSGQVTSGEPSFRPARGSPSLLALRILIAVGAKAIDNLSPNVLKMALLEPLETTSDIDGQEIFPLVDRRSLFHAEAFLGQGDLTIRYLREEPWKTPRFRRLFAGERDYLRGLSALLFIVGLTYLARHPDEQWPLYPGFKLVPGASEAIAAFIARVENTPELLSTLASMVPENPTQYAQNWPTRVARLNEAELGGGYMLTRWRRVPESLSIHSA